MLIQFSVPCIPVAQPRQRHRVVSSGGRAFAHNYTPGKHPVQTFKATVKLALKAAYSGAPLQGPVETVFRFVFPRPQRLVWKKRPMPGEWHASKPDVENVAKAALDALTGLAWADDAQVSRLICEKCIASGDESPRVDVSIMSLTGDVA